MDIDDVQLQEDNQNPVCHLGHQAGEHEDDIFDGHDGEDIHPDDIGFNQEVMETEMKRCDKSDKRENERETLSLGHFVSSWDGDAGTMSTSSHMTHTN